MRFLAIAIIALTLLMACVGPQGEPGTSDNSDLESLQCAFVVTFEYQGIRNDLQDAIRDNLHGEISDTDHFAILLVKLDALESVIERLDACDVDF